MLSGYQLWSRGVIRISVMGEAVIRISVCREEVLIRISVKGEGGVIKESV